MQRHQLRVVVRWHSSLPFLTGHTNSHTNRYAQAYAIKRQTEYRSECGPLAAMGLDDGIGKLPFLLVCGAICPGSGIYGYWCGEGSENMVAGLRTGARYW